MIKNLTVAADGRKKIKKTRKNFKIKYKKTINVNKRWILSWICFPRKEKKLQQHNVVNLIPGLTRSQIRILCKINNRKTDWLGDKLIRSYLIPWDTFQSLAFQSDKNTYTDTRYERLVWSWARIPNQFSRYLSTKTEFRRIWA